MDLAMKLLEIAKEQDMQLEHMAKLIGISIFALKNYIAGGNHRELTEKKIEKFIDKYSNV